MGWGFQVAPRLWMFGLIHVLHYFLLIKAQGFGDVGMMIIVIVLSFSVLAAGFFCYIFLL